MRLGINLGYWGAGNDADNLALAREADRLGYAVAWAAEAYGSDAATVLAWVAAQTEQIDVGSAIFQIPGRTPAITAMTAATLDTLSGGRFRLGLGVSGPQVSEGWHGVRFDKPLARTREYVDDREDWRSAPQEGRLRRRVLHAAAARRPGQGAHPHRAPGAREHPDLPRRDRPQEPRAHRRDRRRLARDLLLARARRPSTLAAIAAGRAKVGKTLEGFDVVPDRARCVIGDDVAGVRRRRCAPTARSTSAAWAAARRTSTTSSPCAWATTPRPPRCRTSTSPATTRAAGAAVPFEFIDRTSLIGPPRADPGAAARLRRRRRHHADGRDVRRLARRPHPDAAHDGRGARPPPGSVS